MSRFPLNPAQEAAVSHMFGPLLVLAGAGSGKTRVITQRIVSLVERGAVPSSIVALTFTNKAAREMRERVEQAFGPKGATVARALTVSTFHSFGLEVLGYEKRARREPFTIFDQGDAMGVLRELLRGYRVDKSFDVASLLARISNAKNAFLSAEDLPDGDEYEELTRELFPKYEAALRRYHAFDFDDLVCATVTLLRDRAEARARWQERFRFVLVDEYQDTNRSQLELLRLLVEPHSNLCVVGDDDQSIYAWRGADIRNILDFERHFPGATVIKLEQNYRSTKPILDVANAVISKRADSKYKKTLVTDKKGGVTVRALVAPSPEIEARHVAREIRRLVREGGRKYSDFAVLYRSNGQAKLLEAELREGDVPYRMVGGTQFFERKEVKDLLAYLKVVLMPRDEIALRRIINNPPRGIGESTLERLSLHAAARDWSLFDAVDRVDALDDITPVGREGCKRLAQTIHRAREALARPDARPSAVLRALAEDVALRGDIEAGSASGQVAARRWGNVEELLAAFGRREERIAKGDKRESLSQFLQMLTLRFADEEEEKSDNVATLSTLHGSKGLEFPVVFLIGCEEGLLPHTRTLETRVTDVVPADIEEERRLFYVGVTRAREELFLSRAKARVVRGKAVPRTPSRFVLDIPEELLETSFVKDERAMLGEELVASANALLAAIEGLK